MKYVQTILRYKRILLFQYSIYQELTVYYSCLALGLLKRFHVQLSWAWIFFLLMNVKMPTIVGILTFMSRRNSILGLSEPEKIWISWYFCTYEHLKFYGQLRWAWKFFYNLGTWSSSALWSEQLSSKVSVCWATNPGVILGAPTPTGLSDVNPFLTSWLVHPYHLDQSSSSFRGIWWMASLLWFFA